MGVLNGCVWVGGEDVWGEVMAHNAMAEQRLGHGGRARAGMHTLSRV